MPTKTLLKLAFIALSTHSVAFAGSDSYNGQDFNETDLERKHPNHLSAGELLPTDPLALVEAPAAQGTLEWPPREIIGQILRWLSKPDLLNVRLVNRELGALATSTLIQRNIPSKQAVERFFQDLTTVGFWKGKNLNFFRNAPVKELCIQEKNLSAETLKTLISAFPTALETLSLYYNDTEGEVTKVLAEKLPAIPKLESLYMSDNKIGDKGLSALLEAIPNTNLKTLSIPVPRKWYFDHNFRDLRNKKGDVLVVLVDFK